MIRRSVVGLFVLGAIGLLASAAEAGAPGVSGVRRTVSIKVFNDSHGDGIYVVGFNRKQLESLSGIPTVQQAKKNGGVYIPTGSNKTLLVPAGQGRIAVFFAGEIPPSGPLPEPEDSVSYNLNNHAKTTAGVDNFDDTLRITIPRMMP
ncbi:MAG: hypothetical protein FJ286_06965 [Planctomycetes bacterium]|nr:hypothetical protein [Planctomycetota bacterium]